MNFAHPLSAATLVSAAVSVVLPWSMWPIVPTLTCGLERSNFSLAMSLDPREDTLPCRYRISSVHRRLRCEPRWTTFAYPAGSPAEARLRHRAPADPAEAALRFTVRLRRLARLR